MTKSAKSTVYDIATDKILAALEKGVIPWKKGWRNGVPPRNLISNKVYRGINLVLLAMAEHESPYFLTFKQIQQLGGKLKTGATSYPVFFFSTIDDKEDENANEGEQVEAKKIGFYRYYKVFNVEQTEGITYPAIERPVFVPDEKADELVTNWKNKPEIKHAFAGLGAYYVPSTDTTTLPAKHLFNSAQEYYAVKFHELVHSTGHKSRLNRDLKAWEKDRDSYSKEELIAEMGAGMLLSVCNLHTDEVVENNAAYIDSWIKELKGDNKLVLTAAAQAQKAADMIQGISYTNEVKQQEEIGA